MTQHHRFRARAAAVAALLAVAAGAATAQDSKSTEQSADKAPTAQGYAPDAPDASDATGTGSRTRVGVLEIRGSGLRTYGARPSVELGNTVRLAPPPNFTDGLTEILTTALVEQGRYQVLERAKIGAVLAEQDLAERGRIDPKTAAASGKVTGAELLIAGDVTEFSYEQSAIGGGLGGLFKKKARIGAGVGKITARMALDLRLIDATTGEVLGSVRGEGKASTTGLAAEFAQSDKQLGVGGAKQTPLGKAARQAVASALDALAETTAAR
jgi:curli biogenesis system outer membrane secretion channel CsgG